MIKLQSRVSVAHEELLRHIRGLARCCSVARHACIMQSLLCTLPRLQLQALRSSHTSRSTFLTSLRALLWPQQMVYSSSVDIRPEWAVVEQIPFTALAKLHYRSAPPARCPPPHQLATLAGPGRAVRVVGVNKHAMRSPVSTRGGFSGTNRRMTGHLPACAMVTDKSLTSRSAGEAEDLAFVGQLHYYDKAYDRVTPKADKPLRRTRRQFRTVTASRDPILQCALSEQQQPGQSAAGEPSPAVTRAETDPSTWLCDACCFLLPSAHVLCDHSGAALLIAWRDRLLRHTTAARVHLL